MISVGDGLVGSARGRGVARMRHRVPPLGKESFSRERLRGEELRPGRTDPPRRGIETSRVEDLPHRGGADLVAESSELTVHVESAWGAVAGFPGLRFPRPLSEPDVRLSPHPALHRIHAAGSMFSVDQADGIVVALQR
jgi:hypothetical protein